MIAEYESKKGDGGEKVEKKKAPPTESPAVKKTPTPAKKMKQIQGIYIYIMLVCI